MKKLTAIFAVVLTLALLLGAVVGVSASAAEDTPAAQADEKWVISANVAYADDIHPYFAIDATLVADASLLSVTVGGRDAVVSQEPISIKDGVSAYVVEAAGVSPKNMSKELSIVVKYNGEVVEETSYSVAEYFYERLYKNDVINATEAADLLRKELYLSTLEYGAAAQNVFPVDGITPIEELRYIYGEGIECGMHKTGEILTISAPKSAYKYYEYDLNGELINVGYTVDAASIYARANTVVEAVDSVSSDFSGFTEAPATGSIIGDLTFVDSNQSGALADYSIGTDEVYGNYYHVNDPYKKGTGYGRVEEDGSVTAVTGQPIFRFVRSLDGVEGNTVVVDVLMRITDASNSTIDTVYYGNNIDFSLGYGGASSNTRSHRVYLNTSSTSNFSANSGNSKNESTGVGKNEWFNIRIVHTAFGSSYSSDSFYTWVYVNNKLVSQTELQNNNSTSYYSPAEKITSLSILPSSDFIGGLDVAKVTFTQANLDLKSSAADTGFAGNDYNNVASVNTTVNGLKTTFTGASFADCGIENFANVSVDSSWINWIDHATTGGQSYIDFYQTVAAADNADKVKVEMDLMINSASGAIPISFRSTSNDKSRIEYVYLDVFSNKIAASMDRENYETSEVKVGEWFKLVIEIEKTETDNQYKTTVYINGAPICNGTYTDEVYTIAQIDQARLVPDTIWLGQIRIDNVNISYNVPSAE
ncbi:MAG: hypothetical protein IJE25_04725 [Clostridia bacterium]|nr:hypothetical protein [Clostridia bacterium]